MTTAQVRRGSRRRRCGRSVAVSRSSGSSITTSYCGDITGARATEGYLLIWLRMMAWAGGPHFNIAVHRADGPRPPPGRPRPRPPERSHGQALFTSTAQTLLSQRPCWMIIESSPAAALGD